MICKLLYKYLYNKNTKIKMLKDDVKRKYKHFSTNTLSEFKAITSGTSLKSETHRGVDLQRIVRNRGWAQL